MLEAFYPREYIDSAYDIGYERWFEKGCRGIIFDVDNTLVPHGAPADWRAKDLMRRLHDIGYKVMILSNNKEPRVKSFADSVVGAEYIYKAGKPGRAGYEEAMRRMGTDPDTTLCIGDQIFTDIWGGNRAGLYTILTRPIDRREEIQIVLKRIPERLVLFFYKRRRKTNHENRNRK